MRPHDSSASLPFRATAAGAAYDALVRLPVVVLLHDVRSAYNVGAFFRTADAAGVERLLLAGITAAPPHRGVAKTALGAEARVPWTRVEELRTTLAELAARGYELAALETTTHAVDLFEWEPAFPVCLAVGHEVEGLPAWLLERCDLHVRIPTLGIKHSLNVATAGGIALFELLRKYRERLVRADRLVAASLVRRPVDPGASWTGSNPSGPAARSDAERRAGRPRLSARDGA